MNTSTAGDPSSVPKGDKLGLFAGERCVHLELILWLLGQPYLGIYMLKLSGVNVLFRIKVRKVHLQLSAIILYQLLIQTSVEGTCESQCNASMQASVSVVK